MKQIKLPDWPLDVSALERGSGIPEGSCYKAGGYLYVPGAMTPVLDRAKHEARATVRSKPLALIARLEDGTATSAEVQAALAQVLRAL